MTSDLRPKIDFYFDFMSPYAYLAHHRLRDIVVKHDIDMVYHPVDLQKIKLAAGNNGPSNRSIPPKIKHLTEDLQRWARLYGIPLRTVASHASERMGRGYFIAASQGTGSDYVAAAFAIGWARGSDLNSDQVLSELGEQMGWGGTWFLEQLELPQFRELQEAETQAAIDRGVFGVPTMIADDGTMWWGNDRLNWVEAYVSERCNRVPAHVNIAEDGL